MYKIETGKYFIVITGNVEMFRTGLAKLLIIVFLKFSIELKMGDNIGKLRVVKVMRWNYV